MDAVCPALQVFHVTPGVNIVKMLSACDQNICGEDESEGENQLLAKKKGKIKKKNTKFAFVFKYYASLFKIK